MTIQQQEAIVAECNRLAKVLTERCSTWLHMATNLRSDTAGHELSASADALYTLLNNHPEIMGSDTGKPAFDTPDDSEFQENMQSLWDQEEPDFRERRYQE